MHVNMPNLSVEQHIFCLPIQFYSSRYSARYFIENPFMDSMNFVSVLDSHFLRGIIVSSVNSISSSVQVTRWGLFLVPIVTDITRPGVYR